MLSIHKYKIKGSQAIGLPKIRNDTLRSNMFNREQLLAEKTFLVLQKYLTQSDYILDVGTGTGLVAELISRRIGAKIECIDVIDVNQSSMNLKIYDGKNIPFEDNTFSKVICCFVLHHSQYPKKLIREIKRVSKSKIFILEDTPTTLLDRLLAHFHSLFSKPRYGSKNMKFHDVEGWKKIFKECNLITGNGNIIEIKKTRDPLYPVSRRMFILRTKKVG